MTTEPAVLLEAAFASYAEATQGPSGYICVPALITNIEGLHAQIYRREGSHDYIVSFRGTDKKADDITTDANLGWPQYEESRPAIQSILRDLIFEGGRVEITGHSLGGALAQFAAYDLLDETDDEKKPQVLSQISLTTWNALGGVWGLERNGGYDPTVVEGLQARHYYRFDDLVARLGKGHVGGEMLRLSDPQGHRAGVFAAHMQDEINDALQAGAISTEKPAYLHIADSSQQVLGDMTMGWLRASRLESPITNILKANLAYVKVKTGGAPYFRRDLAKILFIGVAQEVEVFSREHGPGIEEWMQAQVDSAVESWEITLETAQDLITGFTTTMQQEWAEIKQVSAQLAQNMLDGVQALGLALLRTLGADSPLVELLVWQQEQQLLQCVESITGKPPSCYSLPGNPWLDPCRMLLNARLARVAPFRSPLVLDLGGDGITTLALASSGVRFDLDADGVREACGWIGPREALLVRDLNRDGRIDSGRELFGDHTLLIDGERAAHGFAALAELDDNADGEIDERDASWRELALWRDGDSDAELDAGEWLSLAAADIAALGLAYSDGSGPDAQGNELRLAGHARRSNGERLLLADVWLASEASGAVMTAAEPTTSTPSVSSATSLGSATSLPWLPGGLPDLRGIGRVPSLRQSLWADSSGRLSERLQSWLAADAGRRQELMPEILFLWAGVADLPATAIGGLADQRLLATLHAFSNDRFVGVNWDLNSPSNLDLLRASFGDLCRWVNHLLSAREHLSPLWSKAIQIGSDGLPSVDGPSLDRALVDQLNRATGDDQLIAAAQALRSHSQVSGVLLDALRARAMDQLSTPDPRLWLLLLPQQRQPTSWRDWSWSQDEAELIQLTPGDDSLHAGGGDDVLIGSEGADRPQGGEGNDIILGGAGDDSLTSDAGNDTLCGGGGNDSISVGVGQGLIVFNPGDGHDRITTTKLFPDDPAASQSFTLRFNGSHNAESIEIRRRQQDLTITFLGSRDQLTLADYFVQAPDWDPGPTVNTLRNISFADGSHWDYQSLMQQAVAGTGGNDDLQGCELDETIVGGSGDDRLEGWDGADCLSGDSGADTLIGGRGNNTLTGGSGDDTLMVSAGSNRILYNLGDGLETLYGNSYTADNELILGPGIAPQDLAITRSVDDLLLSLAAPGSGIRLTSFFYRTWCSQQNSAIRLIRFHDGQVWTWQALKDHLLRGDAADNQITGFSNDDTLWGEAGHDALFGRDGNDLLLGGSGNDTLNGEVGSDRLDGGDGDDLLAVRNIGGEDTLIGGGGRNQVIHYRGDVLLAANPEGGSSSNTLDLTLIAPESITLERQGEQLIISYKNVGLTGVSTIRVEDFFRDLTVLNRWNPLQFISFGNGTRWDARTLASKFSNAFMGTSAANKLSGRDSDDWLDGMEGNDLLQGLVGHDSLQGGSGNDTLQGGAGNDLLLGSDGQDMASWAGLTTPVQVDLRLSGAQDSGAGLDILVSIDHLQGGSGNDTLQGNDGANRLDGGEGDDWLDGGGGNDTLVGGNQLSGGDTASYASAAAAVRLNLALTAVQSTGGAGSDGLSGIEHLVGSAHDDSLSGSGVANRLEGGAGNDTLQGGAGVDSLAGGDGEDLFVVASVAEAGNGSGSRDWILDFGSGDQLELSAIDARSDQSGNQAFVWIGSAVFSGLGQLRYTRLSNGNGLLEGNCSGSLAADLQLELSGSPDLAAGSALLL